MIFLWPLYLHFIEQYRLVFCISFPQAHLCICLFNGTGIEFLILSNINSLAVVSILGHSLMPK